ncbi:S-methyl-5-thioribose kinase [uncultured Cohaesibacter sp.]|uniref:S-methyl-5-thioribose kinase n=1 Tax=uncultured Cohaesibacter sp. TaxID=1002546 RepID=UPI0029C6572A|nr:S-methyl-5-thioribose kinase [uncultured Cohaesibacter sp.]
MNKFDSHFRLTDADAIDYVRTKLDYFDEDAWLSSSMIADGNINYVFRIIDEKSGKSLVLKHADVLLRSSGRPLDVSRSRIEAQILEIQSKLAPSLVPRVLKYDEVMCVLVMEDISAFKNLRYELLKRVTFPRLADDISSFIVNTTVPTTDLVMNSGEKKRLSSQFVNVDLCDISEDLVFTEPYIDYKGRNILTSGNEAFVQQQLYEDEVLLLEIAKLKNNFKNNAQALIHGDLHSGSIFCNSQGTKVIDPEFAFFGPIGYDLGNVLAHLLFAWANAVATEKDETIRLTFTDWSARTIAEIISLFTTKFSAALKEKVTDPTAKTPAFRQWYTASVLQNAAASMGMELIRRVVGDTKVLDLTSIGDGNTRLAVERALITIGKGLILEKDLSGIVETCRHHLSGIRP